MPFLLSSFTLAGVQPSGQELIPLKTAIHVHSQFSNGRLTVAELAAEAEKRNLDVLVLSDSFLTTVQYGIWPFDRVAIRGVNKAVRPGVRDHGIGNYLSTIRDVQTRHPDLLIIPAVEVAPYYYWQGNPWHGLKLYDFDRHLLVLGLDENALTHLPVIENATWNNAAIEPRLVLVPLLLLALGVWLICTRQRRTVQLRYYSLVKRRRRWPAGLAALFLGLLLAVFNYPFGLVSDARTGESRIESYQRLIDYVREQGGLVYWSYPEARYSDVSLGGATMISRPHPEDLLLTRNYSGFEGLYGDWIQATAPGNVWDQALQRIRTQNGEVPPWVITGIDFHYFKGEGEGWYDLDNGLTMILSRERSLPEVLASLAAGRVYATFQAHDDKFELAVFRVETEDGGFAEAGESIEGRTPVTVRVTMKWEKGISEWKEPFTLTLIRDGEVIDQISGPLPLEFVRRDTPAPGRHYYRLEANCGVNYRLLSNPIFVKVKPPGRK